ncbi:MAG: DUF1614 domain-containing protein [Bacillota bacterium]
MSGYPIGMVLLIVLSILIYFGFAHRVLDRLRLTDRGALLVIGLMILGSFITIPLSKVKPTVSINLGGAMVPIGLAVYLFLKAGTTKERLRAIVATVATVAIIGFTNRFLLAGDPWHSGVEFLDPLYIFAIIAALAAYIVGRSRRSAFIAATLGILSLDIFHYVGLLRSGVEGKVVVGGAGIFDSIIIAGVIAVLLAEIIGEGRERLQGGPQKENKSEELLKNLDQPMPQASLKPIKKENIIEGEPEREDSDA